MQPVEESSIQPPHSFSSKSKDYVFFNPNSGTADDGMSLIFSD